MPREAEPSTVEKKFVTQALAEGLRLDNRKFEQYRPLKLTFGDQYGMAEVELGKTKVMAKVSAEVTVPYPDRPLEGIFSIASELGPMVAPSFEAGRPTETEVLLSRLLEKTIRRSGALDTESLCLVAGQKCWSVRVDLHVLAHDGTLLDAACLAAVAALRHFRRPETAMSPGGGGVLTVFTPAEREPVPLSWLHSPFCVTVSFFLASGGGGGSDTATTTTTTTVMATEPPPVVLLDTTWLEEQVRASSCTFSMNRHGEICQVSKLGGAAIDALLFVRCARTALDKTKEFADLVDAKLAEDAKRRDKGGLMAELIAENDR